MPRAKFVFIHDVDRLWHQLPACVSTSVGVNDGAMLCKPFEALFDFFQSLDAVSRSVFHAFVMFPVWMMQPNDRPSIRSRVESNDPVSLWLPPKVNISICDTCGQQRSRQ